MNIRGTGQRASRAAIALSAALALLCAAASATADPRPPRPWEDPDAKDFDQDSEEASTLWERTLNPDLDIYSSRLVASATKLLAHRDEQSRSEAEDLLRKAVEVRPDLPTAYWLLGHLYAIEKDWRRCAESRRAVFEIDPEYDPRTDRLIAHQPTDAPALLDFGLARCYALAGDYEKAIEHYKRVITGEKAIGAYRVYWRLGEAYEALGRLHEAIDSLTAAARLNPRETLIEYALAVAYDRDEQFARARQHLATALSRDSHLSQLARADFQPSPTEDEWYYQGLANKAREPARPEWALIYFRRFLSSHENGPWARRARQHVEELLAIPLTTARITQEGPARVDPDRTAKAIENAAAQLQRCVQPMPTALFRVRITVVTKQPPARRARSRRAAHVKVANVGRPAYRALPDPGVRTNMDYAFGIDGADAAAVLHCLDNVAYSIDLPRVSGEAGQYVTVSFPVIAK